MNRIVALWVSWLAFIGLAWGGYQVASATMLDRAPRAALGICAVSFCLSALLYRRIRRRGEAGLGPLETSEPPAGLWPGVTLGRRSSAGLADREAVSPGTVFWFKVHSGVLVAGVLLGVWPALIFDFTSPENLIYAPWPQLLVGTLFGVLPFAVLPLLLDGAFRTRQPAVLKLAGRKVWVASCVVFAVHAAWASTMAMCVAFLASFRAFEDTRLRLQGTGHMTELTWVGLFHVTRAGDTLDICGRGPYFVVEVCDYGPKSRGSCFAGSGGAGFYYTPPETPQSCFNIGGDGALPGGWRWYVAD